MSLYHPNHSSSSSSQATASRHYHKSSNHRLNNYHHHQNHQYNAVVPKKATVLLLALLVVCIAITILGTFSLRLSDRYILDSVVLAQRREQLEQTFADVPDYPNNVRGGADDAALLDDDDDDDDDGYQAMQAQMDQGIEYDDDYYVNNNGDTNDDYEQEEEEQEQDEKDDDDGDDDPYRKNPTRGDINDDNTSNDHGHDNDEQAAAALTTVPPKKQQRQQQQPQQQSPRALPPQKHPLVKKQTNFRTKKNNNRNTNTNQLKRSNTTTPTNTNTTVMQYTNHNRTKDSSSLLAMPQQQQQQGQHFLSHIPKCGGLFAFRELNRLLQLAPEWQALSSINNNNINNNNTGNGQPQQRFQVCNQGTTPLRHRDKFGIAFRGNACTMVMTEDYQRDIVQDVYAPFIRRQDDESSLIVGKGNVNGGGVYTIVRNPRAHLLSQYFHCTESPQHANRAHSMPESLDAWLQAFVNVLEAPLAQQTQLARKFQCYNPIDHQARFLQYQAGHGSSRDERKMDLKRRFTVLGDQARMRQSVCAIYIRYTPQGWSIPNDCNCDGIGKTNISSKNSTTTISASTLKNNAGVAVNNKNSTAAHHQQQQQQQQEEQRHRRLADNHDHGVQHHGDTFKTTAAQDAMIRQLRRTDYELYELVQEIFTEQLQELEHEFNVQLCE